MSKEIEINNLKEFNKVLTKYRLLRFHWVSGRPINSNEKKLFERASYMDSFNLYINTDKHEVSVVDRTDTKGISSKEELGDPNTDIHMNSININCLGLRVPKDLGIEGVKQCLGDYLGLHKDNIEISTYQAKQSKQIKE